MDNFILFTNAFLSYLLLFVIAVCVVIAAVLIGIKLRKNKDAKDAIAASEETGAVLDETSKQS
ncbi:MAG: hypothetical protein K6G12_09000 [Lachnospiraceae bacterium]|nr:hypothetical protein [Lachnospiraceae bacterium]